MKGIVIDDDQTLGYETNSAFRKLGNAVIIPTLNILPSSARKLLRMTHKSAEQIIEHATTHKAMEVLYDLTPRPPSGRIEDFFLSLWLGRNNSRAIRNRLRLVKKELKKIINKLVSENKEVKILNIASGSARAVLESVDEMPLDNDVKLSAVFIDRNQEAISFSQQLAGNHKYQSSFRWVNDTAENFLEKEGHKTRFNTVELVGLLEYLDDENAIEMFSVIHKTLEAGGTLITSNITHNAEKRFISNVVGWKMIYRSTDEFTSLLISAGFDFDKMKIYYEPQRIHCVIVAQK
jgi:hypothetical protein